MGRYLRVLMAVGAFALGLGTLVAVLSVEAGPTTVVAQRFELRDAGGTLRGLFTVTDKDASMLQLYAPDGEQAITIFVRSNGSAAVAVRDRKCGTPEDRVTPPASSFTVYDCEGYLVWEAPRK